MEIENYWKLVIGTTLGISLIIFGLAFWNSATEDYVSHLNEKTYDISSCQQYMDLGSIADRDDCLQKRKTGGIFISLGIFAILLSRVDSAFAGRTFAAYGGVYIVASLVWLVVVEGKFPDRWDLLGGFICIVGASVIIFGPRPT